MEVVYDLWLHFAHIANTHSGKAVFTSVAVFVRVCILTPPTHTKWNMQKP